MIRTTAVPRPVRVGAAVAGIAGMLALAGCATTEDAADAATTAPTTAPTSSSSATPSESATTSDATSSGSTYTDGTYTAEGSYSTPESVESVTVTITLADDVITAVDVTGDPQKAESREYQSKFIGGIAEAVVGKDIDEISVSRVAGSSLTSGGFNQAVAEIKSAAAA